MKVWVPLVLIAAEIAALAWIAGSGVWVWLTESSWLAPGFG